MKIELLFPDVCYLGGDTANFEYLCKALPDAEAIRTGIKQRPAFMDEKVDIILLGTMTEHAQELVRDALKPCVDRIRELIEGGTVFLITGNAVEVFGQYIEDDDGTRTEMLGMLDYHTGRRMMNRHNSHYIGEMDGFKVVGFKSQFGHCYGGDYAPMFRTIRGVGFNPDVQGEGVRIRNFMATYLLGPILLMNPPFMRALLTLVGKGSAEIPFEKAATEAYNVRVKEFSDKSVDMIDV